MKSLLYTGTGDAGTTSLVDGSRVKKNSVRIEAYGTVDELSSALGVVAADKDCPADIKTQLLEVQNELFNIGCYLATEVPAGSEPKCKSLEGDTIPRLEGWIDRLDEQTPKIRAFVLPGGAQLAAFAHVARTVCRRAERRVMDLADTSYVDPMVIKYINRLSDYLFIAARYINHSQGVPEITWKQ
ncbi:MAG: cob(I)yrinic acid a,c-diamide adenosyltransferase [Bacteroidales bacterium]|nr:cob(I)yrinic acid a,c-diamide adenosyltransferase [Bacteroidales bacterium]MBD5302709.1 cob(I)yrinic acid a,c-diamide adenosyltransferase [Bacteroides sp.]MBD5348636.1 cob(I)yrinic acid a,c-diamide adenosyltransferase [Bacteroides sp.]